jgi:hemoglobin
MTRKILIAVALVASSAYVACGGGGDEAKPPVTPASVDSSSASASANPPASAAPVDTTPVATASAAPSVVAPPPAPKSLYDRLGGKDAITKVVDTFIANLAADKRVSKRLAKDMGKDGKLNDQGKKFRDNLIDQISSLTGGDATYKGKDMKAAHKGMKITDAEWTATVEDLVAALKTNGVSDDLQGELLKPLAAMHDDIVEVPAKPAKAAASASASAAPKAAPSASAKTK